MNKQLAQEIKAEIEKAQHILLQCHVSPDPDSVGSVTAMYQALKGMGKKVTAIQGDSQIPKAFRDIPFVEVIEKKNYFEVDLNDFDLFIILDSASIDRISIIKPVVFPEHLKTIVIDHHVSNPGFANINLIDAAYVATCQILYDLFMIWEIPVTPDMAKSLFTGVYTDSGGFKYRGATYELLEVGAKLAKIAPDYAKALFTMENSTTREKLLFDGLALSNIEVACGGNLAISKVSHKDISANNITTEDMSSHFIANTLKSVEGWNIGVAMIEQIPGLVKMSFRTRNPDVYDLSKISAALGGGGHKAAAGVHMKASLEEARNAVVKVVDEYIKAL
ncbi:MAG: DHH family phosphoesterase [Patescibacteria group bacterium]